MIFSLGCDQHPARVISLPAPEVRKRDHELRAFDEFINETGMTFSLVAATRTLQHAVFKRVPYPEPGGESEDLDERTCVNVRRPLVVSTEGQSA
jgi:hypothetical protein